MTITKEMLEEEIIRVESITKDSSIIPTGIIRQVIYDAQTAIHENDETTMLKIYNFLLGVEWYIKPKPKDRLATKVARGLTISFITAISTCAMATLLTVCYKYIMWLL